jgi:hypothetical protein
MSERIASLEKSTFADLSEAHPQLAHCSIREPSIRIWTVYFAKSGNRLVRSH